VIIGGVSLLPKFADQVECFAMFHSFSIAFSAIVSVLCVILAAVFLRRFARVPVETDHGLVRLTIDIFFPCLIFKRIIQTDAFTELQNLWLPPILGFGMTGIGILIGLAIATLLPNCWTGLHDSQQKRTFAACVGLLNYGFVPIPLVDALFPSDPRMMGAFFPMFLGGEASLWTLLVFTMIGKFDSHSWRHLLNGPILTILFAVPLNLLCHYSPEYQTFFAPVFEFLLNDRNGPVNIIAKGAIPVALLMVGLTINEHIHGEAIRSRFSSMIKRAFWSCFIRLLVMPLLILGTAVCLPCTIEIKRVMVIYAAMGSAVFPIDLFSNPFYVFIS
jgi:predicted permease